MPLPGSGAISCDNLQTEFGNTNPIALSEYYRGGTSLVPNISVNNSVPTSGQISISNLYAAEQIDYIPTTFNITDVNISGADSVNADTNTITIAGINTPITLNIGTSSATATCTGSLTNVDMTLEIFKNNVSVTSVTWIRFGAGTTNNITRNMKVTVSSGDTIKLNFLVNASGDSGDAGGTDGFITWTISNDSSSNTSIDTFTTTGTATVS